MRKSQKSAIKPGMNVTPLVDVVLVLLIIFMVITPLLSKQFWVHLPPQETKEEPVQQAVADDQNEALVLSLDKDGNITLSGNEVELAGLTDKLLRVMAARTDKVLFFDAHDDTPYEMVVAALDSARAGGAAQIAVLTKRPQNAQ